MAFVSADKPNPQLLDDKGNVQQLVAPAAIADCRRQSAANSTGQDIFLSTPTPNTYTGVIWKDVDCTSTTFRLSFGQRAMVVADFNAEADCNGAEDGQWCQTRALLSGVEGTPIAVEPSSFAFDSVNGGSSNWQAHAMNRGWEIRCGTTSGCQYKFVVQARMHAASVTGLWLDEIAAHLRISYGNPAPL